MNIRIPEGTLTITLHVLISITLAALLFILRYRTRKHKSCDEESEPSCCQYEPSLIYREQDMVAMESRFIPSIASQSLGRAWHHKLEKKLALCSHHGFKAIEIFMEDLEYVSKSLPTDYAAQAGTSFPNSTDEQEQKLAAASYIRQLCTCFKLDIICLQPFMHYDGLIDIKQHEERIQELHFWISLANRIGTDLIQIPSSFLPESQCTGDHERIISDLREVADIGLQYTPTIRFAYEALCWGTHVDTWDVAWSIIRAVDRPNFGTCLDTFNIAGRIFADPTAPSGLTPTAHEDTRISIEKLRTDLDVSKVFYVEVCDGERLSQPLTPEHPWYVSGQKSRMTWSRNARLFPFEKPGYLPYLEILDAILDAGFEGYISFELFSRTANAADESVPEDHARRGAVAWKKLLKHIETYEEAKMAKSFTLEASQPRFISDSQTSSILPPRQQQPFAMVH